MIELNFTKYLNKINAIKKADNFLTIKEINEDEMDIHLNDLINHLKINSPFENIRSIIRECEEDITVCDEMGMILHTQVRKVKLIGRKLTLGNFLLDTEIRLGMKADIKLVYPKDHTNIKISEDFIYDIMRILEVKRSKLSSAAFQLKKFISSENPTKKKDNAQFSNPEIAMGFSILSHTSKKAEFIITEKNAKKILKQYSNEHRSIKVFLKTVNENSSIQIMKSVPENRTSATKKLQSLYRVQDLINIIDNSNVKAKNEIKDIMKTYLERYHSAQE